MGSGQVSPGFAARFSAGTASLDGFVKRGVASFAFVKRSGEFTAGSLEFTAGSLTFEFAAGSLAFSVTSFVVASALELLAATSLLERSAICVDEF